MIRWAAVLVMAATGAFAQAPVPEPDDYHGEPYNSPVPETLQGARVIDGETAVTLHAEGVPFIDVLPRKTRPEGLPEDTLWHETPHETIPGAVWLWNTGYDRLAPKEQTRLETGLAEATKGDKTAPVVFFCRPNCWMSWNAARRAVEMGYTGTIWFPGGSEAWLAAGGEALVRGQPVSQ